MLGELAIDGLVKAATRGRYEGGFGATVLVKLVQANCEYLMPHAIAAIQNLFGDAPNDDLKIARIGTYARLDVESTLLSAQLGLDVASVQGLVQRLCDDVRSGSRDPMVALQDALPSVNISHLQAVNGLVAKVARECPGLDKFDADDLASNALLYLISNGSEYQDVTPPLVLSFGWSPLGTTSIRLSWSFLDATDDPTSDVWVWWDGDRIWRPFKEGHNGTTIDVFDVFSEDNYWFALRATDADGNVSAWRYLSPCLTC